MTAISDPFYQVWLKIIKEREVKSTYWFSPASLLLASSTSGRPGSAAFYFDLNLTKVLAAFFLGLFSFILFIFVGETADYRLGDIAAYIVIVIVMMAYFFICQFLLSRGNPNALFKDWPIMLALNATIIVALFVSVLVEKQGAVFLFLALGILLVCFAGTFVGAFVASRAARRKVRQR